ncbi:MAG: hypothetical protein ACLFRT_11415 [Actinomycetota bacterium]
MNPCAHAVSGGRPEGPQPAPFTHDPETALASLDRWRGVDARWVLPGHGYPWDGGVEDAVARIQAAALAAT